MASVSHQERTPPSAQSHQNKRQGSLRATGHEFPDRKPNGVSLARMVRVKPAGD